MRLYQYWDTGDPPDEVAGWIDGIGRLNPDLRRQLHDRESASWFIGKHIGKREQRAFERIAVPSMQSDYFRYCTAWRFESVYLDVDFECLQPLASLLDLAPHAMMLVWDGHILASLLMVRKPGNAFVRACLDLSTANVELGWGKNAYMGAGPGVIQAIRLLADPASRPLVDKGFDNELGRNWQFDELMDRARAMFPDPGPLRQDLAALTLRHVTEVAPWLATPVPDYKSGPKHWFGWRGPIYHADDAAG